MEWVVKQGIEVWSTREGQQKFDYHVDYLLNYIRFWQASGESGKTSTRIKQMTEAGVFAGGRVQYGYRLIHKGRTNKKGILVKDKAVDSAEMLIVQEVHRRALYEGVGTHTMAWELNDRGLCAHQDSLF